MPDADESFGRLRDAGVLAIIRYRAGGDVGRVVDTIVGEGVRAIEVTTNTPGWADVVRARADESPAVVGVGTVLHRGHVEEAARSGARFVVSPGFDEDVVLAAREHEMEPLPGVSTATEVQGALRAGVRMLKLFPAGALGIAYLTQLRGPFDEVDFVATGGIDSSAVSAWRAAGARVVALGADLSGREVPSSADEWASLAGRARRAARAGA